MGACRFLCSECGAAYAEHEVRYVCPRCARGQKPGWPTRGVLEVELARLPRRWPPGRPGDAGWAAPFLPVRGRGALEFMPVGGTPLLAVPRLRAALGMPRLWVKDDTRNPSGSTKDRASLLVAAKARQYGFDTVACASTGNAASALASLAAAAGLKAIVFVPAAAPRAKLAQIAAYGATLIPVEGSYDDAFELSLAVCRRFPFYNRNTAYNPFTIEGKKTAALEIVAQLAPEEPDAILVPVGDGVILAGVAKGCRDLRRAGLLRRQPRLIAVQPEGSAAIVDALRRGAPHAEPVTGAASVADSLVVGAPRNAAMALAAVRESGGTGVAVTDQAILAAGARLAALTGVFAEPAGAAPLAGLQVALVEGVVERRERVVLLVTGSGLKDIAAVELGAAVPAAVAPHADVAAQRLVALGFTMRSGSGSLQVLHS